MHPPLEINSRKVFTIVDDALEMRVLLSAMIRSVFPGSEIHAAATVSELLDSLALATPSIIITDLYIRDGSGFEVLEALPREKRNFPILVISFDHRPDTIQRLIERGADDYMNKPLDPLVLRSKVEMLLRQKASAPNPIIPAPGSWVPRPPASLRFSGQLLCAGEAGLHLDSPASISPGTELDLEICGIPCRAKVVSASLGSSGRFLLTCAWVPGSSAREQELHALIDSLKFR